MEPQASPLDDPDYAAFAWGRYRMILGRMVAGAILFTLIATGYIRQEVPDIPWPVLLATAVGIFCTISLTAALMGLMFLSSGTGHDEAVLDPLPRKTNHDGI